MLLYFFALVQKCSKWSGDVSWLYICRHRRDSAEPCSHVAAWRAVFLVGQVRIPAETGHFHAQSSAGRQVQSEYWELLKALLCTLCSTNLKTTSAVSPLISALFGDSTGLTKSSVSFGWKAVHQTRYTSWYNAFMAFHGLTNFVHILLS